jgi:hypothetical protein
MNPYYLEQLYQRLGRPRWFWPLVFVVLFLGLILAGSVAP